MKPTLKWGRLAVVLGALVALVTVSPALGGPSLKPLIKKLVRKEVAKQIGKATGPPGKDGVNGTNGTNGTDGTDGAAGPPGPSSARVVFRDSGPSGVVGTTGSLTPIATMTNVAPGDYLITGKVQTFTEVANYSTFCVLIAGGDQDSSSLRQPLVGTVSVVTHTLQVAHTFALTGQIQLSCRAELNGGTWSAQFARVSAIKLDQVTSNAVTG